MPVSTKGLWFSFAGLCAINVVASLDATALSTSLPIIAKSIDATAVEAYWAGTSFLLASAVFQPIFAAFSNAFGRRQVVLFVLTLFTIGTIICATSHHVSQMLVGRTIQGIGGGGIIVLTYVLIADLLPLKDRGNALSLISFVWLIGTACGPVVGGAFSSHVTWRWIFWITLPFVGIGIALISFCLHVSHRRLPFAHAVSQVDWIGAVGFVAWLTCFLIAMSWGGISYAWSSWQTLVPLMIGIAGSVAWLLYESSVPEAPILPIVVLKNRTAIIAYLGTFCCGLIQFALLYYLPLYYQISKRYSPTIAGAALLPQCILSGISSTITGAYIAKTGTYKSVILVGWGMLALGCGILPLLNSSTTVAQFIFINCPSGAGLGILIVGQTMASQAATADKHKAVAAGLNPFFRAVGQALGIVVSGTIFQNVFRSRLQAMDNHSKEAISSTGITDTISLLDYVTTQPSDSSSTHRVIEIFDHSIHMVWWCLFAIAVAAGLLSLLLQVISLDRPSNAENSKLAEETSQDIAAVEKGMSDSEDGDQDPKKLEEGCGKVVGKVRQKSLNTNV